MKIGVMNASGRLGRKVIAALLEREVAPEDVVACVRNPKKARELQKAGVDVRTADYDKPASLAKAFAGLEVLHLIPSTAAVEPRIQQHAHAVEAARAAGVERTLLSSLSAALPSSECLITPFLLYAESKLRLSGMKWTILRNGMYLDPIADWVPELVKMGRLPYPVRQGRVAFVSRDDLARATAAACTDDAHVRQVYELTGPKAISMKDLAMLISKVTGKTVGFSQVTEEEYAEVCRKGKEKVSEEMIDILLSLYRDVDRGVFARSTDHVKRLTGTPPESVEKFLQRTLNA